ncbi:hypothetical protein KSP39_PZI000036 [Platanthera zijinensis]|uniref:Integrase catalytic domain-containing protein n=1 Tax=Platanthera zijinensis TaxID=2320716 RepID=A0AAP0C180_9ASPA
MKLSTHFPALEMIAAGLGLEGVCRSLFISQSLWDVAQNGPQFPTSSKDGELTDAQKKVKEELTIKDARALMLIYQAISEDIFPRLMGATTAKQAWDTLKEEYQGSAKMISIKLQRLWRDFETIGMKSGESLDTFVTRMVNLTNQIRNYGDVIHDNTVAKKILRCLPPSYDPAVTAIEEARDLSQITLTELMGSLKTHEERIKRVNHQAGDQALQVKTFVKKEKKSEGSMKNNPFWKNKQKGKQPEQLNFPSKVDHRITYNTSMKGVPCIICKKLNHEPKDCFFRCRKCRIPNHSANRCWHNQNEEVKLAEEVKHQKEEMFFTCQQQVETKEHIWFIDSGCSSHMTNKREHFTSFDDTYKSVVYLGDGQKQNIEGKGEISFQTQNGIKVIPDVYYVPKLAQNLLSVGQLMEKGYKIVFSNNTCSIKDRNNADIASAIMSNNRVFTLDMLRLNNSALTCIQQGCRSLAQNWHHRLGHIHWEAIQKMQKQQLVHGLPEIKFTTQFCETCARSKAHVQAFPKSGQRSSSPLQVIHGDLWGPSTTMSNGNSKYYFLLVDDYSRFMWIYFLQTKDEAFTIFKQFKTYVENMLDMSIKAFRSDRGGEFMSNEFQKYCKEMGIRRDLTAPYSPQQNGVVERRNRTVMEMARSMMLANQMPKSYWAEAANVAVYILNRTCTKATINTTPYEVLFHKVPSIHHMRIFGCLAYAYTPAHLRDKLDAKSTKYILVGYSEQSKAYRLFNPSTNTFCVSRNVTFNEEATWDWNQSLPIVQTQPLIPPDSLTSFNNDGEQDVNVRQEPVEPRRGEVREIEEEEEPQSPPRKTRRLSEIYHQANLALLGTTPTSYTEAIKEEKWKDAMNQEMSMITKNQTWDLVVRPKNESILGLKWLYRIKVKEDGTVDKYKARLVAKGYAQIHGRDYEETYSPVARMDTVRVILALAAHKGYQLHHMDVKSAFLNGIITENIFTEQPAGYVQEGEELKVCKLKRALYGLKQAPKAWNMTIDHYFITQGFYRSKCDPSLYTKHTPEYQLLICLYVDDLLIASDSSEQIKNFKAQMHLKFEMSDLGLAQYFLGVQIKQSTSGIFISQYKYATEVLQKYQMEECNPSLTPMDTKTCLKKEEQEDSIDEERYRSLVGSLMYLTNSRPDLEYAVNQVAKYTNHPTKIHWLAIKRILRYVQGTKQLGIFYKREKIQELNGYADADWGSNVDDRKSTTGIIFRLGSNPVIWTSRKQPTVALSTTEAEDMALCFASCDCLWLRQLLMEIQGIIPHQMKQRRTEKGEDEEIEERRKRKEMQAWISPTVIKCDNSSAIHLANNPATQKRSKHIDLRFHFIRDQVELNTIKVEFCRSEEQLADLLTKPLPRHLLINIVKP